MMAMRIGVHLPQFGRAAVAGGMQRAARDAEALGFDDLWVSDHLVSPSEQPYPPPYLLDPLQSLAFAAAATERIGIGTSVLVGPQYTSPLALANSLASLDFMSGGRLTLGIGIGWSRREYEALGARFDHRGERLDEMVALLRTVWRDDPASFDGRHFASFDDIRVLPHPAHDIPIWMGGGSDAAIARAVASGDGYQSLGTKPDEAKALVERLREARPDPEWQISVRVGWDVTTLEQGEMAELAARYEDAGVQVLHVAPERGDLDTWLAGQERLAEALALGSRTAR